LLCDNKMKTTRRSQKYIWWIPVLLGMMLGFLFGVRSVFAQYFVYDRNQVLSPSERCYVSPGQTVVEWKSGTTHERCRESIAGVCIWPIPHKHVTYKVTVNDDDTPLQTRWGRIIPAINGEQKRSWLTYDANSWNALENKSYGRYQYSNFEPIADNEYVVMVETRYRLFSDVDSTLGICIQSQ
jgi:hypothetical protein